MRANQRATFGHFEESIHGLAELVLLPAGERDALKARVTSMTISVACLFCRLRRRMPEQFLTCTGSVWREELPDTS
jgi:hypothetical protein